MSEFTFVVNESIRQKLNTAASVQESESEFDEDAVLTAPVLNFGSSSDDDGRETPCGCHASVKNSNPEFDEDALLTVPVLNFATDHSNSVPGRTNNDRQTDSEFGEDAVLTVPVFNCAETS